MNDKWVIEEENNEETKKHLKELKEYIALFCNKEENKFELYKAIATPIHSYAILISTDIKDAYLELVLNINKIYIKEKPESKTWDEYFSTPGIMIPYQSAEEKQECQN